MNKFLIYQTRVDSRCTIHSGSSVHGSRHSPSAVFALDRIIKHKIYMLKSTDLTAKNEIQNRTLTEK